MYQLNTKAAREADSFGSYLQETGKYIGQFTRAEKLISKNKGTHGIGFTFECNGQTAKFDIWTMDTANKPLGGFKALNAIMACLSIKGIAPTTGTVERYDWEAKTTNKVQAEVFADLCGKDIGLVLQKTEYEKMKEGRLTGEYGWRLELVAPFRAADEFTSSEILDRKTKPEKLASIMATLGDRPLKNKRHAVHSAPNDAGYSAMPEPPHHVAFAPMGDDIPF